MGRPLLAREYGGWHYQESPIPSYAAKLNRPSESVSARKVVEAGHKNKKGYGTHQSVNASTRRLGRTRIQDPNSA